MPLTLGYPGNTCGTVCKTSDALHWEATASHRWLLGYCWEVWSVWNVTLLGVSHTQLSTLYTVTVLCPYTSRRVVPVITKKIENCRLRKKVPVQHQGGFALWEPLYQWPGRPAEWLKGREGPGRRVTQLVKCFLIQNQRSEFNPQHSQKS